MTLSIHHKLTPHAAGWVHGHGANYGAVDSPAEADTSHFPGPNGEALPAPETREYQCLLYPIYPWGGNGEGTTRELPGQLRLRSW